MPTPSENQSWLKNYRETIAALEQIRAHELATLTDAQALLQIKSLSTPTPPWRDRPDWSGLVEQQALFHPHLRKP